MNRKEMIAEIERVCAIIAESDKAYDDLAKVVGCDPESPIWTVISKAHMALIDQTAKLIGDEFDWLAWYICENDAGAKGFEASPGTGKPMRKIKTAAHLARLIEESRGE